MRLALIFILFISCEMEEVLSVKSVDERLEIYFNLFKEKATNNNISLIDFSYSIIVVDSIGTQIGYSDKKNHVIGININYLDSPLIVEYVMLHECGHYFLGLKHNEYLIMSEYFSFDLVNEYNKDKDFYIDELFN